MKARGVFESMRFYNGVVFALERHLERARRGCSALSIEYPAKKYLKELINSSVQSSGLKDGRVRLDIYKSLRNKGIRLSIKKIKKMNQSASLLILDRRFKLNRLARIKSRQREFYDKLYDHAQKRGFDEVVFCNHSGRIAEGSRTNIFVVKDAMIFTPSVNNRCLEGVTRKIVLEIAKKLKIKTRECEILPEELEEADEIFVTNAIKGILPVSKINSGREKQKNKHSITNKILNFYKMLVVRECGLR
ncbi:MAG TPA: aminotransferase class IV [Candidatus Omnitrophota bacterium]|nr:aminotransferase class IV [Candidatus Omnitrophota bacterium]